MSMLTLGPIPLYYWNFIMHHRKPQQPQPHPISDWVFEVHPGAPHSHHGATTQKTLTVSKSKPHLSSHTGTTPPSSITPSSIANSVLTKSLTGSDPSLAKGLYWKPPKTVNRNGLASSTVPETINGKDSDIKIIERGQIKIKGHLNWRMRIDLQM